MELKKGDRTRPSSDKDGRIHHLAVSVLKKTENFVISRRSRAGMRVKEKNKKGDALTELLFCLLNLLFFDVAICCCRRSFVRSLLTGGDGRV